MLNRAISRWEFVLLVINGVIGAGIFGLPSSVFASAGLYSLLALLICTVAIFFIIFCFAEVSSRYQQTGGPYLYAREAFGGWAGFASGWLLLLTRFITYAALINLLVTYLGVFSQWFTLPVARVVVIVSVTLLLTVFNFVGIRRTTIINNIFTIAKLSTLLLFVLVGTMYLDTENFYVDIKPSYGNFSSTVLLLMFAFGGFESVLVNTGEVTDPRKNLPFALINATIMIAVFYMLILVVCIGTLPNLATSDKPLAEAAAIMMGKGGAIFIAIGAICSIIGTLNAITLAGSRLPFSFGEQGHFPEWITYVHPKYKTPVYSLFAFTIITTIISLSYSFISAASISAITRVMLYTIVCIALLVLRKKQPSLNHYRLRNGKTVAIIAIAICTWLLFGSSAKDLLSIAIALVPGIVIYYLVLLLKKRSQVK